ncbi:MAG: NifU family protein [Actinomycetes bacterium]
MGADTALVPLHPEAVDERTVRWVIPAGVLTFVGSPTTVPSGLAALVADGTIVGLVVEPSAVLVTLAPGHSWRGDGAAVRAALQQALTQPEQWSPPAGSSRDDLLKAAALELVDSAVGDYVRSHGGSIAVLAASDGVVEVRLSGTCAHCPMVDRTLKNGVEAALRSRYPELRKVVAHVE